MNLTIGHIPYLNMIPFHQGFGPEPLAYEGLSLKFTTCTPRALGLECEAGRIDAGAMSLVDTFRLSGQFEELAHFGIGVKRAAGSVLLFSREPLADFHGICAVTDETSTSVRLLQLLLEQRYGRTGVQFGRVAAGMYDGSADALLLIGDEALRARQKGVKGLARVTDLATEWFAWQGTPFVFARWMVRRQLPQEVKVKLTALLQKSLTSANLLAKELSEKAASSRALSVAEVQDYWSGFLFELTPDHARAVDSFKKLSESLCLTA